MNNHRRLVIALGASALVASFTTLAQQPAGPAGKIWRVGFLADNKRPASIDKHFHGAFARGLRDLGYVEGKNLVIEYRYAENQLDALAADLVQKQVDVILVQATIPTKAVQRATSTIPIVFIGPGDPVGVGLVKSLAQPGGNTTGLSSIATDLYPKRLELLLSMMAVNGPKVSPVAFLVNPSSLAASLIFDGTRAAGEKLGGAVRRADAATAQDIDSAFATFQRDKVSAVMVALNPLYEQQKDQIGQLSIKHRLPCMAADRMYAEAGCLMSYGPSLESMFGYAATMVDKILKGRKPADLPVEQPTKVELVINGKTAKALGLKIPNSMLVQATKVIE